jgi:predicted glycosyltransferase/glycosyltransferase involved in cell wall biosynthesis
MDDPSGQAEIRVMLDSTRKWREAIREEGSPTIDETAHGPRVIFYSNEMVGLGHLRRTLAIAGGLAKTADDVTSLILTGSSIEPFFKLPPRTDTVKLPVRSRDANGQHQSRLVLDVDELRAMRGQLALTAATSFAPDVALVDKLPLGLGGELEPTLEALKAGGRTKLVLGLRDIDDSARNVRRKWGSGMRDAISRYYDAILVYGPPSTPDAIDCMGWSALDVPIFHVGYVGAPMPAVGAADLPDDYILVTTGGGHDGFQLMATYAEALRVAPLPCETVMVTGPLMGRAEVELLREMTTGLRVRLYEFRTDLPRVIVGARGVVCMAGYNTVSELMRARKPALLVPRVKPSEEQLIRARMLQQRGCQEMLHPAQLTPEALRDAMDGLLERREHPCFHPVDYEGTERAVEVLADLAGVRRRRGPGLRPMPVSLEPMKARRNGRRPSRANVAVITSGFPRLSETFAVNELRALDAQGRLAGLFATKPGEAGVRQPGSDGLLRRVEVLPEGAPADQAEAVAERLRGSGVTGVHGYFAHQPAEVAALAAGALDVPYGFSVHAKDARKVDPATLAGRTAAAACVIACNGDVAGELAHDGPNVHLIPHGVDLHRFPSGPPAEGGPLRLLAVGRLVEKKGFDVLIEAASHLTMPFRLRIIGDGPQRERLAAAIGRAGLDGRVELCGPRAHGELPDEYAAADLVVVPSVVDRNGDRDGLPNVVLEAMASMRPVVASDVAGLGSAVIDGETGLLVPPGDPTALAAALDSLARRTTIRQRLGGNARAFAEREFELGRCTDRFLGVVEEAYV